MKKTFLLLFVLPLLATAQKGKDIFGKFINADGSTIKGTSVVVRYERQLELYNLVSNSTSNNTVIRFSIPVSAASGSFRNLVNSKLRLRSGEIIVTAISTDMRITEYKISLENIAVESCSDNNGFTEIQLNATRIGWTYYTTNRTGINTVSSKTGWDAEAGKPWTTF